MGIHNYRIATLYTILVVSFCFYPVHLFADKAGPTGGILSGPDGGGGEGGGSSEGGSSDDIEGTENQVGKEEQKQKQKKQQASQQGTPPPKPTQREQKTKKDAGQVRQSGPGKAMKDALASLNNAYGELQADPMSQAKRQNFLARQLQTKAAEANLSRFLKKQNISSDEIGKLKRYLLSKFALGPGTGASISSNSGTAASANGSKPSDISFPFGSLLGELRELGTSDSLLSGGGAGNEATSSDKPSISLTADEFHELLSKNDETSHQKLSAFMGGAVAYVDDDGDGNIVEVSVEQATSSEATAENQIKWANGRAQIEGENGFTISLSDKKPALDLRNIAIHKEKYDNATAEQALKRLAVMIGKKNRGKNRKPSSGVHVRPVPDEVFSPEVGAFGSIFGNNTFLGSLLSEGYSELVLLMFLLILGLLCFWVSLELLAPRRQPAQASTGQIPVTPFTPGVVINMPTLNFIAGGKRAGLRPPPLPNIDELSTSLVAGDEDNTITGQYQLLLEGSSQTVRETVLYEDGSESDDELDYVAPSADGAFEISLQVAPSATNPHWRSGKHYVCGDRQSRQWYIVLVTRDRKVEVIGKITERTVLKGKFIDPSLDRNSKYELAEDGRWVQVWKASTYIKLNALPVALPKGAVGI